MRTGHVYKHCVVGHGLTGTAACKYLAQNGEDVVLVGPSEGNGAHGACYDEGRIYRILDPHQSWSTLAERSISRYESIAAESKIDFFQESGLLIFGTEDDFMKQTREVAAKMGTKLQVLNPAEISEKYPWLGVPSCTKLGLLQTKNAVHMSPRKLTAAQLQLATLSGTSYVDTAVEQITQSAEGGQLTISTENGMEVHAENVLVAAGCFTSLLPILPEKIVVTLTGAQAMLVEVSAETAKSLSHMPSMIYEGETEEDCYYLLPPILYPSGKWLIKIGPSTAFAPVLKTKADVDTWFSSGKLQPEFETKAQETFHSLFPQVDVVGCIPLLCVTDQTPTQNAYIDRLSANWGVCTGGNGWAAKSSDEIGLLAAQMMSLPTHWGPDPDLPQSWFKAVIPRALLPTSRLDTALAQVQCCEHVMLGSAIEALATLTQLLVMIPGLRGQPRKLSHHMQMHLANLWGSRPSVVCASGASWTPGHPYISLQADSLNVIVVMPELQLQPE